MHGQMRESVVIRFVGDSGDGMQLLGDRFTHTAATDGNDHMTLPDFPAEIRAPAGTRSGVSGFQIQFASRDIFTPGDDCDVLVAMNPAALVQNLRDLRKGGLVILNQDRFDAADLEKAGLRSDPRTDGTLAEYRIFPVPIGQMTAKTVEPFGLNVKQSDRCKNFFALGMMYWLYGKSMEDTKTFLRKKFKAPYLEANLAALEAGWSFAETSELHPTPLIVPPVTGIPKGSYRTVTGNQVLAMGLVAAAQKAGRELFYGSYPITPASDILHHLAAMKEFGVVTFQAEDEIAAVCAAIGAAFGGALGVTGTSGPGLALKAEAINLAVMAELPLVVVDVQRGGPSTGLPTKTEQADLLQALYGRNGESPVVVMAPATPADCFRTAFDAAEIAIKHMVPVLLLSDGYIANGAEPWRIPNIASLPSIEVVAPQKAADGRFLPYARHPETLARPWAVPGVAGFEHRIGGLEKDFETGAVSYDGHNHERMVRTRAAKVEAVQKGLPPAKAHGADRGTLVLGWGSTFGAIREAVDQAWQNGADVAHLHLRHLNPFPPMFEEVLGRYDRVVVAELNAGQLDVLVRAYAGRSTLRLNKLQGQPFKVREVAEAIRLVLAGSTDLSEVCQ
jgi:2-oxoglutarate ferredoxin oxidoreductase subunit alpha